MQFVLAITGTVVFVGIVLLLPETIHPHTRGADRVLDDNEEQNHSSLPWLVLLNPFASFALLRSPNIFAMVSDRINSHFGWSEVKEVSVRCGCSCIDYILW